MFGLGRREKAASAGVAIASNLLNQLRSFEYEFGFSALKFEDEPYLIGFLIGYAVTASLSTVKSKTAHDDGDFVLQRIIVELFPSPGHVLVNKIINLHNSQTPDYLRGVSLGGKTANVTAGLPLRDDDEDFLRAKKLDDEQIKRGRPSDIGHIMLNLYLFEPLDSKRNFSRVVSS